MAKQQEEFDPELEDCIENCMECHRVCLETLQYCLHMGGKHAELAHIRLLTDCAQICQISADFMIRGSELHEEVCAACAEVCARCGDNCRLIEADDVQMQECAEMCARCAESCAEMAGEE
jgi:hypothetical protein